MVHGPFMDPLEWVFFKVSHAGRATCLERVADCSSISDRGGISVRSAGVQAPKLCGVGRHGKDPISLKLKPLLTCASVCAASSCIHREVSRIHPFKGEKTGSLLRMVKPLLVPTCTQVCRAVHMWRFSRAAVGRIRVPFCQQKTC